MGLVAPEELGRLAWRLAWRRNRETVWRTAALVLAAAVFVFVVLAVLGAVQAHEKQDQRAAARLPVSSSEPAAPLLWIPTADRLGDEQYSVIYLAARQVGAPAPPGIPALPRPGEAFVSPALAQQMADPTVAARYPDVVGEIDAVGLRDAGEKLAYVGAAPDADLAEATRAIPIAGFGPEGDTDAIAYFLGTDLPASLFSLAAFSFLVLPAGLVVVLACRTAAPARDHRVSTLFMIGLPRRSARLLNVMEILPATALGSLVGSVTYVLASGAVDRLPIVEYQLRPEDIAAPTWALAAAVLATVILAGSVSYASATVATRATGDATAPARRIRAAVPLIWTGLGLSLVGVLLRGDVGVQAFLASVAVLLLAIPLGAAAVIRRAGGWISRLPGTAAFLTGRRLSFDPGPAARYLSAAMALLFIVINAQAWESRLLDSDPNAVAPDASVARVVTAAGHLSDGATLGDGRSSVVPFVYGEGGLEVGLADCTAGDTVARLARDRVGCRPGPAPETVPALAAGIDQLSQDAARSSTLELDPDVPLVGVVDTSALPAESSGDVAVDGFYVLGLTTTGLETLRAKAMVALTAPFILSAADMVQRQSPLVAWLEAGVLSAAGLCLLGVVIALVDSCVRRRSDYLRLAKAGGTRRLMWRTLSLEVLVPAGVCCTFALGCAIATSAVLIAISGRGQLSWSFIGSSVGVVLLAVLVAVVAAGTAVPKALVARDRP